MIHVRDLHVTAGTFALRGVSFSVPAGSYAALMGRTGAGKTTLLEALCGLKRIESGTIELAGRDVTHLKPAERGIGFVPQDAALFTTMTVRRNLAFAPTIQRWTRAAIDDRVAELADMLGIEHLLHRRPHGLSGGERQRVALGRALAARPSVLCLDEPLSALDDATRAEMHALLRSVRERTAVTTMHITHNLADARELADRILHLEDGAVTETGVHAIGAGA